MRVIPWREDRPDRWTFVHCFGCTFLAVLFANRLSPWWSGLVVFCIGIGWELCDAFLGRRFPSVFDSRGLSFTDLMMHSLGIILALVFVA